MRIAIDARSLEGDKTGVGRYLENLLAEWKQRTDAEFVLYIKDGRLRREWAGGNIIVERLDNPLGFDSNFFFQHVLLPLRLWADKADFFFSPFYLRPFFLRGRSAIVLHDISYEAHPEWFGSKEKFALGILSKLSAKKADIIFTVSEYSKGEIMEYYGTAKEKIVVTPLAPDADFRQPSAEEAEAAKKKYGLDRLVLDVGTIFSRRRVPEIIEAFTAFGQAHTDHQLLFVGRDKTFPSRDIDGLIRQANELLGREAVRRLDSVPEEDLGALYGAAEAVIYLSDYEGFGLPVVEAQFFGRAVITSRFASLPEAGGSGAEYVEKNDSESIRKTMEKVLLDERYREELIKRGKENVARLSWGKCAADTFSALSRIITESHE